MQRLSSCRFYFLLAATLAGPLLPSIAHAAFVFWDGTGTGWNLVSSWSTDQNATTPDPASPPGASDIANFNIIGVNTAQTVNLNAPQAAAGLNVQTNGSLVIQSGSGTNTLSLGLAGIAMVAPAGGVTITSPISLVANQDWANDSANSLNVTNSINLGANVLTAAGQGMITLGGAVGGSGGLSAYPLSTLVLNGASTYTGLTTLNGGTIVLGNASALGSVGGGTVVSNDGTLDLAGQTLGAEPVGIAGNGVGANGALVNNSASAATLAGTLTLNAASYLGGTGNITLSGRVIDPAGTSLLTKVGNNTLTLSGTTDNTNLHVAVSSGTLVLAKTNDAHNALAIGFGGLSVNGGTAQLAGTGSDQIWDFTDVTVASGAFDTNGRNETLRTLYLQGSGFSSAGALVNTGTASSIITPTNGTVLTGNTTIGANGQTLQLNGTISGNYALNKIGAGILILTGSNTFNGGLNVQNGTLQVGSVNNASTNGVLGNNTSVTLGSNGQTATLLYTGFSSTSTNMSFVLDTGGTGAFYVSGVGLNLALNGAIGGAGTLRARGGMITLGASNAFTGGVTIDSGATLHLANGAALNAASPNAVTMNGGTLNLNGYSINIGGLSSSNSAAVVQNQSATATTLTVNNSINNTFAGILQDGTGGASLRVDKNGPGTLTLSGNNTFSGGSLIFAGTLVVGSANALGANNICACVQSGGTLDLGGQTIGKFLDLRGGTGVGGNGVLVNNSANPASSTGLVQLDAPSSVGGSGDITLSGSVSTFNYGDALTKVGNNTLTLSGTTDNYALTVAASGGTLVLAKTSSGAPNDVHAVGAFGLSVSGATAQLAGTGNDQIWDMAPLTVTSGAFDTNGRNETVSALNLQGSGIGNAGALVHSAVANSTITPTGGTTLTANATIGVTQSSGSLTLNNAISGNFALTKIGAGTLRLSGNSTFSGGFNLNQGTLLVKSSGALGSGPMTIASTGTLGIEIDGSANPPKYDHVNVLGQLTLGGTLNVALINGFSPAAGNSFDILDWGTLAGTFSVISLPPLSAGLTWNTSQLYTTGVLSVAIAGLSGDFNLNGTVDAADYVVWRKGLGTTYTQSDYNTWRAHFGQPPGSGAAAQIANSSAAVPEPRSLRLLLACAAATICLTRRRLIAATT